MVKIKAAPQEESIFPTDDGEGATTTLAGKLLPFLSKFEGSVTFAAIYDDLARTVDLREFGLILLVAWGVVPLCNALYYLFGRQAFMKTKNDFKSTYIYGVVKTISQAATVGAIIYAADCVAIIMNAMGFEYLQRVGFSAKAGTVSVVACVCMRLLHFKRVLIYRKVKPQNRAAAYNNVLDVFLIVLALVIIVDWLDLRFDVTLSSIFAVGGVGTLVISLATKDIAAQLVNGIAVSASQRFFVGDQVVLGDGTEGFITFVGLIFTEIRGLNEATIKIPNSQLVNQRTSNLSRQKTSQVKQTLRFYYHDIHKLPKVVASIKSEIQKACPALITDGSRPFSVHWNDYEADHLVVAVDCRFSIPPSDDNRQAVLEAIARGAQQHNVSFAIPNSISKNVSIKEQ